MKQLFDNKEEFTRRWQCDAAGVIQEHVERRTGREVYRVESSHTVRVPVAGSSFIVVSEIVNAARDLHDMVNESCLGFRVGISTEFMDSDLIIRIY